MTGYYLQFVDKQKTQTCAIFGDLIERKTFYGLELQRKYIYDVSKLHNIVL